MADKNQNKVVLIGISLIVLVFCFTIFRSGWGEKESSEKNGKEEIEYPKISAEELQAKIRSGSDIQILDIRNSDDYKIEHLTDSVNITSEELGSELIPDKMTVILSYPTDEEYAPQFFRLLKNKKFKDVYILTGGIYSWKKIGGGTISIGDPTSFSDAAKITYISSEELKKTMADKKNQFYILDIRIPSSFKSEHIVGAKNIYLNDLEKSNDQISRGEEIFVYGDTKIQGFQAGVRLYDLNFYAVRVLENGFSEWKEKGFPVEK